MKKLALAVAVPLALIGAATFYTSTQIESMAREAVDQANLTLREMSAGAEGEVSLKLLSFDRGLLSSDARYQIDIQLPDDEGNTHEYSVQLKDHLEHGPFPASRVARGSLMPVAAHSHAELERTPLTEALFQAAGGEAPLISDVAIGYDGSQQGELRSAALNVDNEQGTLRVSPSRVAFEVAEDATAISMDGELEAIDLDLTDTAEHKVRMSIRGISLLADKKEDANGFALGPAVLSVEQMDVQAGDAPTVVIRKASIEEALSRGSRGIDQVMAYRIGEVEAQGQTFSNIALAFSLRGLDEASLKSLVDSYKAVLASGPSQEAAIANMTDDQQSELQAQAMQLLQHKPTLALDEFGFETANGAARLSVIIDLQGPSEEGFTPDAMIASMLGSLKAEAGVDKGLVRDIARLVAQREQHGAPADPVALKQQADATAELLSGMALGLGWFQLQGDRLVSSLQYADDTVALNGRDMSVPEFISFAFGSVQGAGRLGQ